MVNRNVKIPIGQQHKRIEHVGQPGIRKQCSSNWLVGGVILISHGPMCVFMNVDENSLCSKNSTFYSILWFTKHLQGSGESWFSLVSPHGLLDPVLTRSIPPWGRGMAGEKPSCQDLVGSERDVADELVFDT